MSSTGSLPPGIEDAELIAHGGFAAVYRGWQPDFHRQVAVKILSADAGDPAVRARFDREVRAMGSLSDHPHVVPVYDAGIHDDRPYLVMPYLAGGSLADELRNGPLAPDDVVRVGRAVADALEAAHQAGLLHRDIKPANILRTSYGEPKLADFGIARFGDTTATHGNLALTVAYAAPELLQGEPATVASDVYSLGATLHALLRGAPPFQVPEGGSPMAVAMKIVSDEPPPLVGVPPTLADVVERAMAKDPSARFPSAAAMRDALDGLQAATVVEDATRVVAAPLRDDRTAVAPALAPPRPNPPPARRPPRRRGGAGWAAALVALLVLGAIAAALFSANRDDDDPTAATTTSTTVPASETTAAPVTEVEETTTTTEPTTTTLRPDLGRNAAVDAAEEYFALLDAGDIDGGWNRLSPAYQEASGQDAYYGFWETIESVEVKKAKRGDDDLTAVVTLRYTRDDGTTTEETNTLRFVEGDDGELLVDGSS